MGMFDDLIPTQGQQAGSPAIGAVANQGNMFGDLIPSQQPIGQSNTQGMVPQPNPASNPQAIANNQQPDALQQLHDWSISPTNVNLSDLPQSGQGLSTLQKLGFGAKAIGRGLVGSAENSMIKPTVKGFTELMQGASGQLVPGQNLSPEGVMALSMMSPTLNSGLPEPLPKQEPIANRVFKFGATPTDAGALEDSAFGKMLTPSTKIEPMASADAKAASSAFYQKAAESGDTFPPEFTNSLIEKTAAQAPQTLAGKATTGSSAIADLADRWETLRDKPLDMQSIQEMDEGLGDLIDKEILPTGRPTKVGKNLMDVQTNLRDSIMNADVGDGGQALQNARQAWSQGAKMSDIERIMTRAENSDNPATAIKAGVRTMLSNPKRIRGWSPQEIAALKDAGDRGAVGGLLHVFGSRLGPLIGGAMGASGGPLGAVLGAGATYGLSTGARNMATQMQMNRASNVLSTLGQGVPKQ